MKGEKLIGKKVFITDKESWFYNSWGIVVAFDGEYYHVKDANGDNSVPIFSRDQFRVKRESK